MTRQYTFKTTKATEWLESILDSIPCSNRSAFIRETLIDRLQSEKGLNPKPLPTRYKSEEVTPLSDNVTQKSDNVTQKSDNVTQKSDNVTQKSDKKSLIAPVIKIEENDTSIEDLENKLSKIQF